MRKIWQMHATELANCDSTISCLDELLVPCGMKEARSTRDVHGYTHVQNKFAANSLGAWVASVIFRASVGAADNLRRGRFSNAQSQCRRLMLETVLEFQGPNPGKAPWPALVP